MTNVVGGIVSSSALLTITPITPVIIGSVSRLPGDQIRLQGSGDAGYFIIQGSSNLISWSDLTNLYSGSGAFEFTDGTTNGAQRFYRARLYP